MSDHPAAPKWETVCYPERRRLPRRATDDERQAATTEQAAEDARRIAGLADWVLAEGLRQAADDADEFEQFMADPTQRMRTDELDALRAGIEAPGERGRLIAAALRRSPTEAFLEIVAQMVEGGALANRSRPSTILTIEQIEFVAERERIKSLLLRAYETKASQREIERRATEVARHLCGVTAEEASTAKKLYDDNFTKNAELRWILLTKTIARRN